MLLESVDGTVTQRFGPSSLSVEPSMYSTGDKAYWLPYFGASFFDNFHPGIDRAAVYGTPIKAMESGTVVFAGWKDNISGRQVEVAINDSARYSMNHLSYILCRVGQKVQKGDVLGRVGDSGATTGPHVHEGVSIREPDRNGVYRTFLYNAELFLPGGSRANDPIMNPEDRYFAINGTGINIRKTPISFEDRSDVFARSMDPQGKKAGIYRLGTGNRIGPIDKVFHWLRDTDTEEGEFRVGTAFGRKLAVRKTLTHWVEGP